MQISAHNVPNLLIFFYVRRTRHTNEIPDLWFHGGVYSDYTILGCDTVTYAERTTNYTHLAPTAVGPSLHATFNCNLTALFPYLHYHCKWK